jgi:hypothetical protein
MMKGKLETKLYTRPYLFNAATGVVITAQHKAWMDSVGTAIWADTVIGPSARGRR